MILYNVTVNVESEIEEEWLVWMKGVHVPEVLGTGCFTDHKFLKLLNESPETQGATYAIQYFTRSLEDLDHYLRHHAPALQKKTIDKYQHRCVSFRTFLEEI